MGAEPILSMVGAAPAVQRKGGVTVTPISRPVVKSKNLFLAARAASLYHWFLPATVFEPRPFLRLMAAPA
jgi:hypothetical protein